MCLQVSSNKRYAAAGDLGFTVSDVARNVEKDFGKIDVLVHSLANGPEVTKPLLETSRKVCPFSGHIIGSFHSGHELPSCPCAHHPQELWMW